MEMNKVMKGALLLTVAGVISKLLSAGYRIPLQNLTGDIGFYMYQQVYPILGIALVLALYGFPTAISKLTAEEETISYKNFILPLLLVLVGICWSIAVVLYVFADSLAMWIGDDQLAPAYRMASAAFLFIPFTALLRGVFQGKDIMKPTAYSQLGEQLVRVAIIITIAVFVAMNDWDSYVIGTFAGVAAIAGSLVAISILLINFRRLTVTPNGEKPIPWKYYLKSLLLVGIAASLNHMLLLLLQFADAFTMVPGLLKYGYHLPEAMEAKGVFDRGQPLIQIGAVLGSAFGLAIIPSLSKDKQTEAESSLPNQASRSVCLSIYLAVGATLGLMLIFPEANRLLYQDNQGDTSLTILMLALFLSAVAITTSAILQGLGYIKRTAVFIGAAFLLKWIANGLLVPLFGITGSALATNVALLFLLVASFLTVKKQIGIQFKNKLNLKALSLASICMSGFLVVVNVLIATEAFTRLELFFYISVVSVVGGLIYISILHHYQVFTEDNER